ncbi:MAG: IS30 family transposase [Thermoanaerobaculia bacterium]
MGCRYEQFGIEERCEIARRRGAGQSIRQIAASLDRAPSSVSRELKRNNSISSGYQPVYAGQQAKARRWSGSKLLRRPGLQALVLDRLSRGWSPQEVAGRLAREQGHSVISHETIYRFIAAQIARTKDYSWRLYLPRGKSKRGFRTPKHGNASVHIPNRVPIGLRPPQADDRTNPGHWEADLILFATYGQAVLALHERTSRLTVIVRQPNKKAVPLAATIESLLAPLPPILRRTMTFDNGTEFAFHHHVGKALGIETFFCDPRSPWQKGGVENAIGRLRRFLPRKTNLAALPAHELLRFAQLYNHTPRKCLDFQTPAEVFSHLLHFKCDSTFPLARG